MHFLSDSDVTEKADLDAHLDSVRDVSVLHVGLRLFVLLNDGCIKFIIIELLIRLSVRVRIIENRVEL
jgi:hypothetical protein